jgi:metal-responsive CopG/Arc/MetJ family transcriptional regulator
MRQVAIRLPLELIDELDAKVAALSDDPLVRAERSTLVRVLLTEAIEARRKKGNW